MFTDDIYLLHKSYLQKCIVYKAHVYINGHKFSTYRLISSYSRSLSARVDWDIKTSDFCMDTVKHLYYWQLHLCVFLQICLQNEHKMSYMIWMKFTCGSMMNWLTFGHDVEMAPESGLDPVLNGELNNKKDLHETWRMGVEALEVQTSSWGMDFTTLLSAFFFFEFAGFLKSLD